MRGKISVIVPVYNVERYITECLESLIHQTYQNLEILLVDDGSTDRSGSICDEYGERDSRIIVIHQKNGGAAAAKNTGLDHVTGTYLAFADSDDWLERDALEYMIHELEAADADIVQCSFRDVYIDHQSDCICKAAGQEFDQVSYLARYTEDWTCSLLWDKLYKRELFDQIRFETGHVVDDEYFTYQGVMNARKIACRNQIVYNYRKRKSGATGSVEHAERIISDKLDYLEKRLDIITERYPQLKKAFNRHLLYMLNWMSEEPSITEHGIEQIQQVLQNRWKQCRFSGEGWRTELKLLKLMRTSPQKFLEKKDETQVSKESSKELFE